LQLKVPILLENGDDFEQGFFIKDKYSRNIFKMKAY